MKKFVCLLLACLLLATCAGLAEEVDENVIAIVNGEVITNEEANAEYAYNAAYYAGYGITDEDTMAELRSAIADIYVQDAVMHQKIRELGLPYPTEEELDAETQKEYDDTLYSFMVNYGSQFYQGEGDLDAALPAFTEFYAAHSDMFVLDAVAAMAEDFPEEKATLDGLTDDILSFFEENNYSLEAVGAYIRQTASANAVYDYAVSTLEITDDDVRAYYDELVSSAQADSDDNPGSVELNAAQGQDVYYVPEGYRYIKHILVLMDSADQNSMYSYTYSAETYRAQLESLADVEPMAAEDYDALTQRQSEIEARLTEIDGLLEAEDADIDALSAEQEALQAEKGDVEGQIASDAAVKFVAQSGLENALAQIEDIKSRYQPQIDEIYSRLEAGESFDALILELGEDPGMFDSTGEGIRPYMVYEKTDGVWEENFAMAAVSLEEGQYTPEAVWTSYGAHIILYDAPVPAGAVEFDVVRDSVTEEYTANRQTEVYDQLIEQWKSEADIQTWPEHIYGLTEETEDSLTVDTEEP